MAAPIQKLMQKEVSRKEFLATLGFGVASIFGLSALLRLLGHQSPLHHLTNDQTSGYSSGAYGGSKD